MRCKVDLLPQGGHGIEKLAGLAEAGDGDGVRAGLFSLIASAQHGQEATAE
jgi:hypothetical protein